MAGKNPFDDILNDPLWGHYILSGHTPIKAESFEQWAQWHQNKWPGSIVGRREYPNPLHADRILVSTVFLGLDHGFVPDIEPILFETMIFWKGNEKLDDWQDRYATWEEAELGHRHAVELVELALGVISKIGPEPHSE